MRYFAMSLANDAAEAMDMLRDSGQSGREGLGALLDLVVAFDLFVMDVDRIVGVFCFVAVHGCCVGPCWMD
jgi:hypothetical protein